MWLKILQSFLKLGKKEQLVLSRLLYYRHVLSKEISNKSIVEDLTMGTNTRKEIKKELNMDTASFNNMLSSLRKKNMIVNNTINKKIVPNVEADFKNFKLVYNIEIHEDI